MEEDSKGSFSNIPHDVIHVEDTCRYIHFILEEFGTTNIYKHYTSMCKNIKLKDDFK